MTAGQGSVVKARCRQALQITDMCGRGLGVDHDAGRPDWAFCTPREPVPTGFAGLPPAGPGPVRAAGAGLMCVSGWPAWKVARMAETALIRIVTQLPALQRLAACGGGGWRPPGASMGHEDPAAGSVSGCAGRCVCVSAAGGSLRRRPGGPVGSPGTGGEPSAGRARPAGTSGELAGRLRRAR